MTVRTVAQCARGRAWLLCFALVLSAWSAGPVLAQALDVGQARRDETAQVDWYDLRKLPVEGRGWSDTAAFFDRLPARAEGLVRKDVWGLSRQTAGLCARFTTSATAVHCRWKLTSTNLALPHMPATGVSGVDLYVRHGGAWRWLATGFPKEQVNQVVLVQGLPPGEHEFLLYLPLYNGVAELEVGVPRDAPLAPGRAYSPDRAKPLVFYGTSITQGGCASRPGMVHTAILQRRLERPVINLGFSGNGRLEAEVGQLLAELDPAVYVLDCLPNLGAADVKERTEPLVKILRQARPETPILLVEDRSYTDGFLLQGKRQRNLESRKELRAAFDRLQAAGVTGLHYLEGEHLLGDDNEGTVDSSHPTDLGFVRQADAFEIVLRKILNQPAGNP